MSFNLESAASPNWMGLTASIAGQRGLIVGWDGSEYTLELESGKRIKTADFVWEYDTLADEDTMRANARLAALRSEESPYKTLGSLNFDPIFGAWDGEYLGDSLLKLADDLEALSDDEFGGQDEPEDEDDQGILEELQTFLMESLDGLLDQDPDGINDPLIQAIPVLVGCATDPELDPSDFGVDISSLLHETSDDEHEASVKESIAPAVALAATAALPIVKNLAPVAVRGGSLKGVGNVLGKIPGASKAGGLFKSGLQAMGMGQLLGMGGGVGQAQTPIQVSRPHEFGLYHQGATGPGYADRHFELSLKQSAKGGDELLEGMRTQVINALTAFSPHASEVWGEYGDGLWYVTYNQAANAGSVTDLQSILQSLPPEYHNAASIGPSVDEPVASPSVALPTPGVGKPRVPGGTVPPEPGPAAPSLGGGPLTPGGPSPVPMPGTAPGGGIPGGPGRRTPMPRQPRASVTSSVDAFEEELYKTSMGYPPLGDSTPQVSFGLQQGQADEKIQLDTLAQTYINQGMSPAQAYGRASMDIQQQQQAADPYSQMSGPTPVTAPTTYAPTPPTVTSAAMGTGELPVIQDGRSRATLRCPNCKGQTIGYAGENKFVCRTCGNEFNHNIQEDKTSSVKWADTSGNPLEVGKLYKMHMPGVPVPDFVRVTWMEPENIRVAFAANGREDDITEQYEFELVDENDQGVESGHDWILEGSNNDEPLVDPKIAGAQFNSQEQREFIDEDGEARNKDKLNLEGTHYRQSAYDGLTDIRPSQPNRVDPNQFLIG
jgi:hypothetical protein